MRALPALLLFALLVAPAAAAQPSSSPPPPESVWTVFTTVEATVRDNYATVKVIADIGNRGPDPEFPFVVRVPDDAFVTGLTIERDGTVHEAQVKDREEARQEYEEWKAREETGGLVEKTRRTNVYSYLVNVAEFTSVRAVLTYERYLAADAGVYNLSLEAPVSGFGEDLGARFDVTVTDADGVVALWGEPAARESEPCGSRAPPDAVAPAVCDPTGQVRTRHIIHEVGPRPGVEHPTQFTASYMLGATADAGSLLTTIRDGQGYFAHRFRATDDSEQLPMDLVLVLDVSGSMAGLKLQQMIDAAKQVVGSLDEEDRLHIVAFSSDANAPWQGLRTMTPENRKSAAREIDALFDGGGTNIEAGLRRGFAGLDGIGWREAEGRFPALVLLTDGQPTAGVTSREGLLAIQREANAHDVPVFGIAFGDDADWALVRALAHAGEGAAVRVPLGAGAEVDLRRFMSALTTPVLRDVQIAYSEGVEAFRPGAPVLLAGSELLVVGTFDPARGISGTVTGFSPEGARRYDFAGGEPGALPFLPRLVAYQQVRALQEAEAPDVAAIKELALAHGFVTDHTSLVLTLPAREFTPGGEARGNTTTLALRDDAAACCGDTRSAVAPTAGSGDASGRGIDWWPFDSTSQSSAPASYEADGVAPTHEPTPAPQVPGPGFALVLVALAALALLVRRR